MIGAGEVGFHLAKFLSKEDHRVTLVDPDAKAIGRASRQLDVQTVEGSGCDASVLKRGGIEKADLLVAVTAIDEVNMLASLVGKRLGAARTVVRVHAEGSLLDHQYFYKDTLGFDLTISPDEMAALEIVRICRGQNSLPVENFCGGRLQMRRLEILSDSPAVGKKLMDLKLPRRALVSAIARGAQVTVPRGDVELAAGDFALLVGVPEALDRAEKVIGGRRDLPRRVMIVGGGSMTLMLVRDLGALGIGVRVIERDSEKALKLSTDLAGAEVVCGVGTDVDLLQQEGIHKTDIFVSLASKDEVNLLACQLAKKLGAKRTVALVNRPDYAAIWEQLGIDHAVSPRRLVAKRIAQFVRSGARGTIARLHRGAAEVVDMVVPEAYPLSGHPLREIPFPVGSIVGGIIRDGEVLVPDGSTPVLAGDHLIVFAVLQVLGVLERVFETPEKT